MAPEDEEDNQALLQGEGDELFNDLLETADAGGGYRRRFNMIFNLLGTALVAMCAYSLALALTIPDHWCHVPGREHYNLTLQQWKELTIPRDHATGGSSAFSKCKMFNITHTGMKSGSQEIECQYGWDFDRQWFRQTIPSQEFWVCRSRLRVNNVFSANMIAEAIGVFLFGNMADRLGRRPVFLLTFGILVCSRVIAVMSVSLYPLFLITCAAGNGMVASILFAATNTGFEGSTRIQDRGYVVFLQTAGWSLGLSTIPLVAWMFSGYWVHFMLAPLVPAAVLLIYGYRRFLESPRWLMSTGQPMRCSRVMVNMAGRPLPEGSGEALANRKAVTQLDSHSGLTKSVLLFTSGSYVAANTLLILFCWACNAMTYYMLLINVTNLAGNPFLNFFWQACAEFPASLLAQWIADRAGRRVTYVCASFVVSVVFSLMGLSIHDMPILVSVLVVVAKCAVTVTYFVCYLQAMEIFPTSLRQTGISLANLSGNIFSAMAPYVLYLGTEVNISYPYYLLGLLAFLASLASTFLPETLNKTIPETVSDVASLSVRDTFWRRGKS